MSVKPRGFTEAGISTSDMVEWIDILSRVGGYRELWRGRSSEAQKTLWGVAPATTVTECLLGAPGVASGYIRLFQFEGIAQEEVRGGAESWDSGGIFDLDLRVPAVRPYVEPLIRRGWKGVSEPVDWNFGDVLVREWLTLGPDSSIFALIQRLAPPLAESETPESFGPVFNSSQIVSDMAVAIGFYGKLGFSEILHHRGPLAGRGGEVLGLSSDAAPETPVDLVILQPEGKMSGSVELVCIEGVPGRDVSSRGLPYNLGLNLLRFPVEDAGAYAVQLESEGLEISGLPVRTRLEPFGETEIFAVRSPDGAWLEFYSTPRQ